MRVAEIGHADAGRVIDRGAPRGLETRREIGRLVGDECAGGERRRPRVAVLVVPGERRLVGQIRVLGNRLAARNDVREVADVRHDVGAHAVFEELVAVVDRPRHEIGLLGGCPHAARVGGRERRRRRERRSFGPRVARARFDRERFVRDAREEVVVARRRRERRRSLPATDVVEDAQLRLRTREGRTSRFTRGLSAAAML